MRDLQRELVVGGLSNARDLGGLPRVTGGTTPYGVFFRSANLDAITLEGWDDLRAAGIRTVVDLRRPDEREHDQRLRPSWLATTHVDLDGLENHVFWADYRAKGLMGTALYFLPHLAAMPERTGAVLTALAEAADGGVLFHCMKGRDRTGMISMVLLSLAGVEPEAIVADYLTTSRVGDGRPDSANRSDDEALIQDVLACYGTTTEQAFRSALVGLDLNALLNAAGVRDSTQHVVRSWRGRLSPIGA